MADWRKITEGRTINEARPHEALTAYAGKRMAGARVEWYMQGPGGQVVRLFLSDGRYTAVLMPHDEPTLGDSLARMLERMVDRAFDRLGA